MRVIVQLFFIHLFSITIVSAQITTEEILIKNDTAHTESTPPLNTITAFFIFHHQIIPFLAELSPPPGRMQQLENSHIWVDYAHTPDALDNALSTLKTHYPEFKIRVLFGCGGDRDKGKRQIMGKIASETADSIILTNDNPRSEDPQSIV
ncbi:MAG: cyanophycin synthetase, partial [Flavobacteriaceae bacterium]|nr:cyanophycin synthetase [Flavobacteriaceae bacterium]